MLVHPVVVGGDGSGPHVDLLPELGVADVAEVVHLGASPQLAFLHLHKVADAAAIADIGGRPQVSKGTDGNVIADVGLSHHGVHHTHVGPNRRVLDQAAGADPGVVADHATAAEVGLRFDHHIAAETAAFAEGAAFGINEGDPFIHPVVAQPLLQQGFALGQLPPVVDAVHLIGIGHLQVHGLRQHRHRVGEIELPLIVVGAELRQNVGQGCPVEAVDPGVGEVVAALLVRAIAMLNDAAHLALGIGEHTPVTGGILEPCRQQGDIGTAGPVLLHQCVDCFTSQQRYIAVEHEQFPFKALQRGDQLLHRMARAVLGLLQNKFQASERSQLLLHPFGLMPNDQQPPFRLQVAGTGEHPFHQGGSRQRLEHFRECALHAGAFSSGQYGYGKHAERGEDGRNLPGSGWTVLAPAPLPGIGGFITAMLLFKAAALKDVFSCGVALGITKWHGRPGLQVFPLHRREVAPTGAVQRTGGVCRRGHGAAAPTHPFARGRQQGMQAQARPLQAGPHRGGTAVGEQPSLRSQALRQRSQEFLAPQFRAALGGEGVQQHQIKANGLGNLLEHRSGIAPELDALAVGFLPVVGFFPAAVVANGFKPRQHRG